jgi:hypothetical protein
MEIPDFYSLRHLVRVVGATEPDIARAERRSNHVLFSMALENIPLKGLHNRGINDASLRIYLGTSPWQVPGRGCSAVRYSTKGTKYVSGLCRIQGKMVVFGRLQAHGSQAAEPLSCT